MVRVVTNVFWVAFLVDGVVSLADEAVFGGNPSFLSPMRLGLAIAVILLSFLSAVLLAVTPRAPVRVLAPLVLFTWWGGLAQGFPLGWARGVQVMLWVALAQVALATLLFVFFRCHEGRWPFAARSGRAFSWRHALVAVPTVAAAFVVSLAVALFAGLADELESVSGGYVRLRPDGIYLLERTFQSGDREVRLSGMMHIAEEEFYTDLLPSADPSVPSVVLVEGVTDNHNLLGEQGLSYARLASMLRISSQEDSVFMERVASGLRRKIGPIENRDERHDAERADEPGAMDFVHADVDVGTFHPKTIAFVIAVMGLFQAEDWPSFVKRFSEYSAPLNDESSQTQVIEDILHSRNKHLVGEIETSLKDYRRVIIPWGALHLTGVESWLRTRDFQQSGEIERKALGFW